jgi:hypothetical protein
MSPFVGKRGKVVTKEFLSQFLKVGTSERAKARLSALKKTQGHTH